jgi:hypothetical protein
MLSLKSHVKLKPVTLSNIISAGKLRSRHPAFELKPKLSTITPVDSSIKIHVHAKCSTHTKCPRVDILLSALGNVPESPQMVNIIQSTSYHLTLQQEF